ncbi:MAG: hypothetical protein RL380_317 [Verrucomicrobiota bacterium]|jgi:hypothetical protein
MKLIKLSALLVCATALFVSGCASCCGHKSASCPASAPSCGHKCCIEGKTDCAHCATCSAHK